MFKFAWGICERFWVSEGEKGSERGRLAFLKVIFQNKAGS